MQSKQLHVSVTLQAAFCRLLFPPQFGHQARHGGLKAGKGAIIGPSTRHGAAALVQPSVIAPEAAIHVGGVIERAKADKTVKINRVAKTVTLVDLAGYDERMEAAG
ncbi:hypothetical protein G6M85_17205 [Agrobacterium tumefaciens]|uniref:hypothetical protein n=1 Tax=Agrobacterium tumefaciens TaxID=358 RepID=UPI001571F4FE|nr:hypothetical protein [Agrobacterium tumefaciens]NTE67345.1 hypothetical protein [Agrobacterium tumefaciens]